MSEIYRFALGTKRYSGDACLNWNNPSNSIKQKARD